jgi:hypothetical protein
VIRIAENYENLDPTSHEDIKDVSNTKLYTSFILIN